ncbi:MFS transporter [Paludisphaera borealis]|uniref:Metabolite transport protein YjhB n=1 Tax=Paludisphaera borealis TaxID=1387353 RepID=A0A1U7CTD8_9BACT|nr:MFS transporter [Paludisphaera borealis]APW62192.1 Putative metabolite transport protein YjhB [Paludisphaera borealis]
MNPHNDSAVKSSPDGSQVAWWRELTGYQWFVFLVASLGWLFDTMDQQLFNLARNPAVTELLKITPGDPAQAGRIGEYAGYTTSIFILGWATGGIFFGILGDKIGRAKTMMLTILSYSAFTGLSALSVGVWDFAAYRFLTGLGVGGQFAVGVSLVAEVMSDRARPYALGWLQALSAVGNMLAAVISIGLGMLETSGAIRSSWRAMFLVGLIPSLLAIPVFLKLKEPERWKSAVREEDANAQEGAPPAHKLGSLSELFGDPRWRRNTIVGMILAFSGVVGLWGIGVFSVDLNRMVLRKHFEGIGLTPQEIGGKLTFWAGMTLLMFNAGAFFGIQAFAYVSQRLGRRPAFAISFILAAASTSFTFLYLNEFWQIFVFIPIMGFCQLALFGGYAIYFPELFPTRLRSTGTSFCYNVARYVAAAGPSVLGLLTSQVFYGYAEPMRYAGVAMCSVFVVGLLALPFAPETRGKPLPE